VLPAGQKLWHWLYEVAWLHEKQSLVLNIDSPPTGGDKHPPADGCDQGVFALK
jgi:hypothetical protein